MCGHIQAKGWEAGAGLRGSRGLGGGPQACSSGWPGLGGLGGVVTATGDPSRRLTWLSVCPAWSSAWSVRTVWPSSASTPRSGSSRLWARCLQGERRAGQSPGAGGGQGGKRRWLFLFRGPHPSPTPHLSRAPLPGQLCERLWEPCLAGHGAPWGWGWAEGGCRAGVDTGLRSLQRHRHRHLHHQLPRGLPVHRPGQPRQHHRGRRTEAAGEDLEG